MSFAADMLQKVEAMLLGKSDVEFIDYGGMKIGKSDIPKLLEVRDKLKREVAQEERAEAIANGLNPKNKILVRF